MFFKQNDSMKTARDGGEQGIFPLLPLRDVVIFPHMMVPLFVGRAKSILALEEAMKRDKDVFLVAQKQAKVNEPEATDVYDVGTIGSIVQILKLPDGTVRVLVEGKQRARILHFAQLEPFFLVEASELEDPVTDAVELKAMKRSIYSAFETYLDYAKKIPKDILKSLSNIESPSQLADTVVLSLNLKLRERQELLELVDPRARLEKLYEILQREIEILQVERRIKNRIKKQMERNQKEYYLNEQMSAIQKELGEQDEFKNEIRELDEAIRSKRMSEEARTRALKELKKLKMMSPMSAEATVVRNYIDWIVSLPWAETTEDVADIDYARKVLAEDHYGLQKPKERILEYLAVKTLAGEMKGPILCFVGPPGVGKTSIAKSIARATGRKFVRLSLGGVRDEAEIRGHRRTYIGALPGKLLQSIKKAASGNPVFLLDEIDKLSSDYRGDPSSALLEALDPEQNHAFNDHYLDLDYDLSKVLFVTTANYLNNIPPALRDRLEIIHLPGYTEDEKLAIARQFLVPKQIEANGLKGMDIRVSDGTILKIIQEYTREAGVRSLERELATIMRKVAVKAVKDGRDKTYRTHAGQLQGLLGVPKYRREESETRDLVGFANGLAWTEVGGELLHIEVAVVPGKGKLILTGKLGEVMQESAQAALSWVRANSDRLGLKTDFFQQIDVHIHLPEGATPKDGPSAGVAIVTALVSALTGIPSRHDVAMTGEITLRGRVLQIGGLKEKLLAAHRERIGDVLIPKSNELDLSEAPKEIVNSLSIHLVEEVEEVLDVALCRPWTRTEPKAEPSFDEHPPVTM
ncbi:MAG: endopeptidase La [Myxococcales bacterium]|nr:MAG: endopeptidase La [Myxococcales bacterium]